MTYIDLKNVTLTSEMQNWLLKEIGFYRIHWGEKLPRNGMWRQQREKLGLWLDDEDAIVFRLKFTL